VKKSTAVLFLDKKNQKSRQQNASFAAHALALQIMQNHRAVLSSPASHPRAPLQLEANALPLRTGFHVLPDLAGSGLLPKKNTADTKGLK